MELNVPGVSVEAMKRPFDAAMKLHVQDVRLVDRMQTFGPTYETVLCASGRGGDDPASPTTDKSSSPPTSRATESAGLGGGGVMGGAPTIQRLESTSTDVFSMTSCDLDSLLVLTYSYHSPNSPRHPAVRDLGEDEYVVPEREASIRKVNVRCTAMEAIGQLGNTMWCTCASYPCVYCTCSLLCNTMVYLQCKYTYTCIVCCYGSYTVYM